MDFCEPPPPPRQFRTEALHEKLHEDGAEYAFFVEAFGLIDGRMQAQFQRLVRQSFCRGDWTSAGLIDWSSIDGLGAGSYLGAIRRVVQRLPHSANLTRLQQLTTRILMQRTAAIERAQQNREATMVRGSRAWQESMQAQQSHEAALDLWQQARATILALQRRRL